MMRDMHKSLAMALCVCVGFFWALPSATAAKTTGAKAGKAKKKRKGGMKVRYTRRKKRAVQKIPPMTRSAALELERWFAPLSIKKGKDAGTHTMMRILRTWIASRWGARMKRPAWNNWAGIRKALGLWNPAPLYHEMKKKWDKTWVVGKQIKNRIIFTLPKSPRSRPKGIGRAAMGVKLTPLKRMPKHKRRPYLFTLTSYADIPPIRIRRLDSLVKAVIERVTDPKLNVTLPKGQKPLFQDLAKGHSRKVADWLTSRFPVTAHLLDRYLHVYSIVKPLPGGLFKMDVRAKWKLKPLKRDYPALAKRLKWRRKNRAYVEISFMGSKKRRRWLKWSYDRVKMEHRYQAILSKGGLMLSNKAWRPMSGPWRPTAMGADWHIHANFRLMTPQVRVKVSKIWFRCRVKPLKRGASLLIEMSRAPKFEVKGGEFLRFLARMVIPGGVERMARWFIGNLATGNQGRGLVWRWDLIEHSGYARVLLTLDVPMVSSRTLTSVLRLLPSLIRRQRGKKKRKNTAKSRRTRRRKRRNFNPLWWRLYNSIHRDIKNARKVLAKR